jgi:hypothetical protein
VAVAVLALAGCSNRQKKLSTGGGPMDALFYDVLGQRRSPTYYYTYVRDSHEVESFCYRCGDDPYVVDKNVDAIQALGDAAYARLEGQAQVVALLMDVLASDPAALARAASAVSLTKIGLRLPRYEGAEIADKGDLLLARMRQLDGMHAQGGPGASTPAARAQAAALLQEIGGLRFDSLNLTMDALKFLYTRPYLIDERDPGLRAAIDTALTRRMASSIRFALRSGAEALVDYVREDSIRGLKVLGDATAEELVVERLAFEPSARVRAESVEYLGKIGTPGAAKGLLDRLADADAGVRLKAREALTRMAGQDLGPRRRPWARWARARFPGLQVEEGPDDAAADRPA